MVTDQEILLILTNDSIFVKKGTSRASEKAS